MAKVVYAAPTDELAALVAKLSAVEEPEVVLLVPKRTRFLREPLHWNLLQRHIRAQGKLLVVVTQDREVVHCARRAGFATYRSLRRLKFSRASNETASLKPFLRKRSWTGVAVALGTLVIGALLFVGILAYVAAPAGSVVIRPPAQEIAATMVVTATQSAKAVNAARNELPARVLQSPLEATETIETTGRKTNPARARGDVTLLNRTAISLTVPFSTGVASGLGAEFMTQETVTLAPFGGTARAQIVASQPGPSGNVPSMAIDRLTREPFVSSLAVWNELPTSGGASDDIRTVSAQDQSNVQSRLQGRLAKDGQDRIHALKSASESVYPATVSVSGFEESFDRQPGDETANLTLRMKASVRAVGFDGKDVNTLAEKVLQAKTPAGLSLQSNTVQVTPLEAFDWGDDWVTFRVSAKAMASALIETDSLLKALEGKTASEARTLLETKFPIRDQVSLDVTPLPLEWVPVYSWKLEVRY